MQSWRRLFYFLLLNVLVSAVTVWAVVSIMMRNNTIPTSPQGDPTLIRQVNTPSGDEVVIQTPAAAIPEDDIEVVSEILAIKSIIGIGELQTERVMIEHIGEKEVSLSGWQLQDQDGNVYTFPSITMFSGGAVTVYTRTGTSSVVELYWGQDAPVWSPGEKAYLLDSTGTIQAVYVVP